MYAKQIIMAAPNQEAAGNNTVGEPLRFTVCGGAETRLSPVSQDGSLSLPLFVAFGREQAQNTSV